MGDMDLEKALAIAVHNSDGDPQLFAYLLSAPISAWMQAGLLNKEVGEDVIQLLRKLHPPMF